MRYLYGRLHRKLLISTFIIIVWALINYILFYPSTGGLGDYFGLSIMFMITEYWVLIIGVIMLVLRATKALKSAHSFFAILMMEINILVGLVSVFLYLYNKADLPWLHRSLLNLLVGVLLLGDFLLFKQKKASE